MATVGFYFLTNEAVNAGKTLFTAVIADYAVKAPDFRNVKYLDQEFYPSWPSQATVLSGQRNVTYTITHNLGYFPVFHLFFKDLNGRLIRVPGKGTDSLPSKAIVVAQSINHISVQLGQSGATYPLNTTYDVYHWINLEPNEVGI